MAEQPTGAEGRISLQVSTAQRPEFKGQLEAYVFDSNGQLAGRSVVQDGRVDLPVSQGSLGRSRVFIAPVDATTDEKELTAAQLERLGAYEPVLKAGGRLIDRIEVPGPIIDIWPFCFCWVRGRVVRLSDNRPVCNARVHICEVDRVPIWIERLPDSDIFRLRDDLLEVLRRPPIPRPDPNPGPLFRRASRTAARFGGPAGGEASLNPQPLPPRSVLRFAEDAGDLGLRRPAERVALNPQPLPPRETIALAPELHSRFRSTSQLIVRQALVDNWKLLLPWFCYWPRWWWLFRCDEIATVGTDDQGRFERIILYRCGGDHPDLYFWVEYDFGDGFETVYHPRVACNTYWDYVCGTEVTIRVTDPRVPGCGPEPDLPGRQVVVVSIGPGVAVREVQTSGALGLTAGGEPFGATLEPRADFSRTELIGAGVPYYRWSYRRLTAPDGTGASVDPASVPIGSWSVMTRDVYRHYKDGTTFPSDLMGPMPISGINAAPAANLFRIRPTSPPTGAEWVVLNENVDLATAYFDTGSLAGNPTPTGAPEGDPQWTDDLAAGLYELKLELFDTAGALVDWTAQGIDLRITDQDAPFGTGTVTTTSAPVLNRVLSGGNTVGFRMTVRVDNNRCFAEVHPVGGTVTPDPICGFHNYSLPSDSAALSFTARHPNNFANYSFSTTRGPGPVIPDASTSGTVGAAGNGGFVQVGPFDYSKNVVISSLLGSCSNAAFAERLDVGATATNGYSTLTNYNAADNAAFALATPCPECDGNQGGG